MLRTIFDILNGKMAELKRTLRLGEVIFFASGVIIGAGIYTVIGKAAGLGGNMLWLSFAIASLTALLTIFAYAELSAMYPKAGGEFFYVKEILGKKFAYVIGCVVALGGIVGAATIAIGFSGYLAELIDFNKLIAALLITAFILLVNTIGIKQSSLFNIIFTIIEACGLIFVIYCAINLSEDLEFFKLPPGGVNGILSAAALGFFAFTGFEDTVKLAEETKNPATTIPKALFSSATIVILLYIIIALSSVSAISFEELEKSDSPLADIAEKKFGRPGAIGLAVVALFSTSNSLLSNMLGASRIVYQMAKESSSRNVLSKISEKRQTPIPALLLCACCSGGFIFIGDIKSVALIANFFVFATFLTINITVICGRFTKSKEERPFRIPLNIKNVPVISGVAVLMLLVLIGYAVTNLSHFIE
ncbi:amino acid transporter [Sphingobacteriaceae bacterium]|nr:amino acid transporter [Sphingobacteriaceae bacterium]